LVLTTAEDGLLMLPQGRRAPAAKFPASTAV
jgi:hypothetical protein